MAKRKTRQHKIALDQRRSISEENSFTYNLGIPTKIATNKPSVTTPAQAYPYLIHDLTKTAILTALIVAIQLSLYFLLKNHVLTIPGLGY